jgi:signal transduction histidine kinase
MTEQPPMSLKALSPPYTPKSTAPFLIPAKKVFTEIVFLSLINFVMIYSLLFFIPDTAIAMIGVFWVGIIAWRGGILAGLLSCLLINFSTGCGIFAPPHDNHIYIQLYFANRIPGYVIGLFQNLFCASIVGYISTLVHKLRAEVQLRKDIQKDLEKNIAELDAFGHTVAHDLKNPLTIISMSINVLLSDFEKCNDAKTKKKLSFINSSTTQMINIIESILMLAGLKKIDPSDFTFFPISQSIDEALKRLAYNIEENSVIIHKPHEWPSVSGYAPWITEVWVNYINNAIKYGGNPTQGLKPVVELGYDRPQINTNSDIKQIRFWVKDNGEGIDIKKSASLFKEFTRLHSSEYEGHGLGLSIVKAIVDKFGGTVGVESEQGKGSLFYFTLPEK